MTSADRSSGIPDDSSTSRCSRSRRYYPIDDFTLLVGLDNNYPGGNGRVPGTPDGTEIITLRSKVPLGTLRVQPCKDGRPGGGHGGFSPPGRGDWDRDFGSWDTGNKCW